jgi:tetratricopeptide (TPR) repeat protein
MFKFLPSRSKKIYAQAEQRFVALCVQYTQEHPMAPDLLGAELPNILVAIQICEKRCDWVTLGLLIHAADQALLNAGRSDEYLHWLEMVLADTGVATNGDVRDLYLALMDDYATTLNSAGERDRALALYHRVLDEARDDRLMQAFGHMGLATIQLGANQPEIAKQHLHQVRAISQQLNEPSIVNFANYFLGEPGDYADVLAGVEQTHRSCVPQAAGWRRYMKCQMQAMRHFQNDEYSTAITLYHEAIEAATALGDEQGKALALYQLGEIARRQDRLDEALDLLQQSEDIASRVKDHTGMAAICASTGRLLLFQGRYDLALPYLRECVALESEWGETEAMGENLYWLGYAEANTGHVAEAQVSFRGARSIFARVAPDRVADVDRVLARLNAALEQQI